MVGGFCPQHHTIVTINRIQAYFNKSVVAGAIQLRYSGRLRTSPHFTDISKTPPLQFNFSLRNSFKIPHEEQQSSLHHSQRRADVWIVL